MEDPHVACDTIPPPPAPQHPKPSSQSAETREGRWAPLVHINWNRCSEPGGGWGGVVFSSSTSQEIIKQIYCRGTVFGVPCEQTERGNGSTSGRWGR